MRHAPGADELRGLALEVLGVEFRDGQHQRDRGVDQPGHARGRAPALGIVTVVGEVELVRRAAQRIVNPAHQDCPRDSPAGHRMPNRNDKQGNRQSQKSGERRQDQQRKPDRQQEQQGNRTRQQGEMGRDEERFRSDY